jgi:hypothetical protein
MQAAGRQASIAETSWDDSEEFEGRLLSTLWEKTITEKARGIEG